MDHGSNTPRTDLSTYLRCLLEAVRRMLGGRWGFLMRPVAGLLMGREARKALLQAAAAFEQLAVLLEQFRAGKFPAPEEAPQEEIEATPRAVAARARPSTARREPRWRSADSTPELRGPAPAPRAKAASTRQGASWRRMSAVCRLSYTSLDGTGGLAGDFRKNGVLGRGGYCVHFVTIS